MQDLKNAIPRLLACLAAVWISGNLIFGGATASGAAAANQPYLTEKAGAILPVLELKALLELPVFDPEIGQVVPLDSLMRKTADRTPKAGTPANGSLGAAYLAMVQSGYLLDTARLVPDAAGGYVTIAEAQRISKAEPERFNVEALHRAGEAFSMMCEAYGKGDGRSLNAACRYFAAAMHGLHAPRRPAGAHLALWSGADRGLTAAVAVFRNSFQSLADALTRVGLSRRLSELLATFMLSLACLLLLVLAWSVPRLNLRRQIARARREAEEIRGKAAALKATSHSGKPRGATNASGEIAAGRPPHIGADAIARLANIERLKAAGRLTDDEYRLLRDKILGEI